METSRRRLTVPDRLPPYYSLALAAFVVTLDYAVGPRVEFPGLSVVPVMYGAWYGGVRWGLPLSLLPFAHVATVAASGAPEGLYEIVISAVVRALVLIPVAWWIATVADSQRALKKEGDLLEGLPADRLETIRMTGKPGCIRTLGSTVRIGDVLLEQPDAARTPQGRG